MVASLSLLLVTLLPRPGGYLQRPTFPIFLVEVVVVEGVWP